MNLYIIFLSFRIVIYINLIKVSAVSFTILIFDVVMTNAEKMKKYREKLKKDKVKYESVNPKLTFLILQ